MDQPARLYRSGHLACHLPLRHSCARGNLSSTTHRLDGEKHAAFTSVCDERIGST